MEVTKMMMYVCICHIGDRCVRREGRRGRGAQEFRGRGTQEVRGAHEGRVGLRVVVRAGQAGALCPWFR